MGVWVSGEQEVRRAYDAPSGKLVERRTCLRCPKLATKRT